jgi:hypothetical protein
MLIDCGVGRATLLEFRTAFRKNVVLDFLVASGVFVRAKIRRLNRNYDASLRLYDVAISMRMEDTGEGSR